MRLELVLDQNETLEVLRHLTMLPMLHRQQQIAQASQRDLSGYGEQIGRDTQDTTALEEAMIAGMQADNTGVPISTPGNLPPVGLGGFEGPSPEVNNLGAMLRGFTGIPIPPPLMPPPMPYMRSATGRSPVQPISPAILEALRGVEATEAVMNSLNTAIHSAQAARGGDTLANLLRTLVNAVLSGDTREVTAPVSDEVPAPEAPPVPSL